MKTNLRSRVVTHPNPLYYFWGLFNTDGTGLAGNGSCGMAGLLALMTGIGHDNEQQWLGQDR